MAVSGVISSESMKTEKLFQFTLMNCYLPYTYQNHSKNETKKFIFKSNQTFVTISGNRIYCNNKPTDYQIWCILVFIATFFCVNLTQKKEEKTAFCLFFYHFFCAFSRCNAVVSLTKNSNIILLLWLFSLLINQFTVVCCWKISWTFFWRWTRKIILLVKRLIS